jgi:hypothetical protein
MTCREKWESLHPGKDFKTNVIRACPWQYGYLDPPDTCGTLSSDVCDKCWDREIPEETKKEKPMSTKKTKAELMEELEAAINAKADLEKQLAELEKYKTYRTAGDELKAIHTAFMDAGFDSAQAFTLLQTMMMNSMAENLTRDLRKVARR